MFSTWQRQTAKRTSLASTRRRARRRPQLERLEDRLAPAVHTWVGDGNCRWDEPDNWDDAGTPWDDPEAVIVFPNEDVDCMRSWYFRKDEPANQSIQAIRFDRGGYRVDDFRPVRPPGLIRLRERIDSVGSNTITADILLDNFGPGALTFNVASNGELRLTGDISGSSDSRNDLLKSGPGRLVLTGRNTYQASTLVGAGTLVVGAANALPSGRLVNIQFGQRWT